MGYWEVPCQFCGVSFNISRIRSKCEPRSAAFITGGPRGWIGGRDFARDERQEEEEGIYDNEECSLESDCCMVFREADGGTYFSKMLLYDDDPENEVADDPDYEYMSHSDSEPLEYTSDVSDGEHQGDEDTIMDHQERSDEPSWLFNVSGPDHPEYDIEFLPLSTQLNDRIYVPNEKGGVTMNKEAYYKARCYEHIAGPDCRNSQGYLARNISPEEMRHCHTVQCLLAKREGWEPQVDDLDFEQKSRNHLTGVVESMPSSGYGLKFAPVRHGVDDIRAETDFVLETSQEELQEIGLPFHPTCFELFIQASRRVLGVVDIDTLVRIRDKACLERRDFPVEHHQHVYEGQGQCWSHNVGHEYLVANPVFVPALKPILDSATCSIQNFSVKNSPFAARPRTNASAATRDLFLSLPIEIILSIVDYLGSADIAALRLSSRAFTHLPISLWYRLILREVPWLYEAWSSDPKPYHWATVIATDLKEERQCKESWDRDMDNRSGIIASDMPEVHAEWLKNKPRWEWPDHPDRQDLLNLSPVKLAYGQTNWYNLYRDITVNWKDLKGLQNRARIWDAVLQVIDVIKESREKGDGDITMQ
ncbi:hypothetical protein BBP40_002507 [Aspergillus hancockii]|nr:hypothetical protein BBP40_002507 [Aspergillus hancockii]